MHRWRGRVMNFDELLIALAWSEAMRGGANPSVADFNGLFDSEAVVQQWWKERIAGSFARQPRPQALAWLRNSLVREVPRRRPATWARFK